MKERQEHHSASTRYSIFNNPLFQQGEAVTHMEDLQAEPIDHIDPHSEDEKPVRQDCCIVKRKSSGSKKKIFSCENEGTSNPPATNSFFDGRIQGSRSTSKKKHKIFDNYTSPNVRKTVTIQPFVEPFRVEGKKEGKVDPKPALENHKVQPKYDPKINLETRHRAISETGSKKKRILWAGLQGSKEKMKNQTIMTPEQLHTLVYRTRSKRAKGKMAGKIVQKIIQGDFQ